MTSPSLPALFIVCRLLLSLFASTLAFAQIQSQPAHSDRPASLLQEATNDARLAEPTDSDWPSKLEPLHPLMPRDEFEIDRIHAAALFAEARILQQRGEKLAALRKYERSWRYHQNSETLRGLVESAMDAQRFAEAADYVLLDAGRTLFPDRTLLTLATSQSDRKRTTAELYQLWLDSAENESNDQLYTLVSMETGRLYHDLEEYEKAAEAFKLVLEILDGKTKRQLSETQQNSLLKNPDKTFQMMADAMLKAGDFAQAESLYRRGNMRVANPARLSRQLARVALSKGDFASARILLDQSLKDDRNGRSLADSFQLLSEIMLAAGADEKQITGELIQLIAPKFERFDDPELANFYVKQLRLAGETERAIEVLQAEITKVTFPSNLHRALIELYAEKNDADSLLKLLASLCDEPSQLKDVAEELNPIAKQEKLAAKLVELAEQNFAADGELDDEQTGQAIVSGFLALKLKRDNLAAGLLSFASKKSAGIALEIAQIQAAELADSGQHSAASKVLQLAIDNSDKEREYPFLWYLLAGHLEMAGESEQAIAAIEHALSVQPDSPMLRFRLGWIHYHAKQFQQAEAVFRKLVEDFHASREESLHPTLKTARMLLSSIANELNSPAQSQEWLEQILDESPRDPAALNDLGYQWVDRGVHLQRGWGMIATAVAADPKNAAYQDSLGWALFRLGRISEAIGALEKVVLSDDADGVMFRHLGEAYAADQQTQKALVALRKSIELFENAGETEAAEKVRQLIQELTTE